MHTDTSISFSSAIESYIIMCAWSKKKMNFSMVLQTGIMKLYHFNLSYADTTTWHQKLHGVTHFSRIQAPISSDPLNGIF
jgi:hypothetical protein